MTTFKEMLIRLGSYKVVDPVVDISYEIVEHNKWLNQLNDSPHGRPWHVSFHASQFPGDNPHACSRFAMYQMMDIPTNEYPGRWLIGVADVGKEIELQQVRRIRDAGYLVRSNQSGRSSDPDARDEQGNPMPQMGFQDEEHWLTGSVDLPLLPFNYNSPHIVEIKTKHEDKIDEMQVGHRNADDEHRRQLLCSLGMAHDSPNSFIHPTEDRILEPARDGSIFYIARDSSWHDGTKTHEFYYEYDAEFMEQGYAHLKQWKENFLNDELPSTVERKSSRSHPFGWLWSKGACEYCPLKKACKSDYELGINKVSDSTAVALAKFTRPGYDEKTKRDLVLQTWNVLSSV